MNVLFLPGWYPNRTHPTLGNFVQRHAEAVATLHPVTVVHAVKDPGSRGLEHSTTKRGQLTEHLVYSAGGPWSRMTATLELIARLHREGPPFQVVHGNILHATAPLLLWVRRRWKLPFLVSENWTGYHVDAVRHLPLLTRLAMRLATRHAAYLCPVSEHLAAAMRRHGLSAPHRVVPNVVDTDQFHPPDHPRPVAATRFLHVSTLLDEHKNVTGLLHAFAQARRTLPGITLHILGDGDRAPHERTATALGLPPDAVTFEGPSPLRTIAERMRNADAFVLPSNHENLPCVMLEAFACGLPVVATDVGGIPEHLAPERGILIRRGDMDALHHAFIQLAQGAHPHHHDAIRQYAVDRFSMPVVAGAFDALYRAMRPARETPTSTTA